MEINKPILMSTWPLNQWLKLPETDAASTLFAPFATAKVGGIPKKIKIGVIIQPPPIPSNPEKKPANKLTIIKVIILMLTSAKGK